MTSGVTIISLGSNLGDREAHLSYGIACLHDLLNNLTASRFLETRAEGRVAQPLFLNAVVAGETSTDPVELLEALLTIETDRGRTRPFPGAPRTLDLDLVLVGDVVVRGPGLTLPHPRFRERRFVLEPLTGLVPDLVDPVTGLTIRELLSKLDS